MEPLYLKVPCEMAQFALTNSCYSEVRTYLASQFYYSGIAKASSRPTKHIGEKLGKSESTIYRHFQWLTSRNWLGKDEENGWWAFRGLDRVHQIEGWQFARAAIMYKSDLVNVDSFFLGVFLASLIKTGKEQQSEPTSGGSLPSAVPLSLKIISSLLDISKSTAQRLRNKAEQDGYIKSKENLIPINNLVPVELKRLKVNEVKTFPLELLGYSDRRIAAIDRIRYNNDKLYLQGPNLITGLLKLKSRRGLASKNP